MTDISKFKLPNGNEYDLKDNIARINYDKTVSRGLQLVTNGSALMGNNTNFSSWTYDGSMANGSGGSFTKNAGTVTIIYTDDYFPVNPSLPYILEFDIISALNAGYMYSFFSLYDADKRQIGADDYMYVANTLTTLSQELKNGDTVVHLTSNANWDVNTGTATHKRGFIFWNYTNSFGYQYPELTYSRNHWANLYPDSNVDKTTNTITLSAAWNHGTIPAGTKVSQSNSGSTFKYIATAATKIPTTWTHYKGTMIGVDYSGQNASGKFPPAVAYAKVGFLWNYQGTGNNEQFWLTNLSVKTLTDVSMITGIDTTYLKLAGGTMTGKLTAPYIETGSADNNYFQSRKFRGEGDASTYYHAIDFGYSGNNKVDFYEYGGIWNFYRNTTSAKSTTDLAGTIKYPDGWVGKVNNHTVNADVPADAVFTDTVTTVSTTGSGNAITAISASNGVITATKGTTFLTSHQTIKQDGVTGATVNRFGACSTAAATAEKTVSITTGTFTLETGAKVTVKFTNKNTANSPTLNVNSTGAKNIYHNGAQITSGTNKGMLYGTVEFVYDGTQWQLIGNYVDTNTAQNQNAFSNVKVGSTTIAADTTTDTIELVAGDNVTLTPDTTNDKVTIAATQAVTSVAGKTGAVTLSKSDVGLGNVDNTADANKHVLTAKYMADGLVIDGLYVDGGVEDNMDTNGHVTHYCVCSTAAATAAKVATTDGNLNWRSTAGTFAIVKFTNTNTAAVTDLTLKVGVNAALPIKYRSGNLPSAGILAAGRIYLFVHDGTNWELVGDLDPFITTTTEMTAKKPVIFEEGIQPMDSNDVTGVEILPTRTSDSLGGRIKLDRGEETARDAYIDTYDDKLRFIDRNPSTTVRASLDLTNGYFDAGGYQINGNTIDYIVDSGFYSARNDQGGCNWVKWNSGRFEMWFGRTGVNIASGSAVASFTLYLPFTITDLWSIQFGSYQNTSAALNVGIFDMSSYSTSTIVIREFRNSGTADSWDVGPRACISVQGTWK